MSKLDNAQRSALQSARAKNRKLVASLGAAGLLGVTIPKNIVTKIQAIEVYFAGILDAQPKAEEAATGPVQDQETAVADAVIAA